METGLDIESRWFWERIEFVTIKDDSGNTYSFVPIPEFDEMTVEDYKSNDCDTTVIYKNK